MTRALFARKILNFIRNQRLQGDPFLSNCLTPKYIHCLTFYKCLNVHGIRISSIKEHEVLISLSLALSQTSWMRICRSNPLCITPSDRKEVSLLLRFTSSEGVPSSVSSDSLSRLGVCLLTSSRFHAS